MVASMQGDPAPPARRAGRPTTVDRLSVGAVALRLWHEQGFSRTTWAEIADAAGISERTLVRHFGAKEDLAWVAVPPATQVLQRYFDTAPTDAPLPEVVAAGVMQSLLALQDHLSNGPLWLRLVSDEPALRASATAAYQPWIDAIADHISARLPHMPPAACRGIATAYQTTAFEALMDWSGTNPTADPAVTVSRALAWLQFATPAPKLQPRPTGESHDRTHT